MNVRRGIAEFAVAAAILHPIPAGAGMPERLAVQLARDALPRGAVVLTHPATDAIEALRGLDLDLPGTERGPAEAAREWVRERAAAFGLDPAADRVEVARDEPLPDGGRRVLLRQTWNGWPVEGGDARLVFSASGRLRAVASQFQSAIRAPGAPRLARGEATARAATAAGVSLDRVPAEAELRVFRGIDGDRLAWRVRLERADGLPVTRWVDAVSGEGFGTDDGCARAVGLVYPTDPRQPEAEVALLRLLGEPGLRNRALAVEDQQYPLVTALGPGGDYRYPPSQGGFDQVNVYWHSDRFLDDYLGGLGYAGPPESLIVRVHAPLEPNVALTSGRYVYFGRPVAGFTYDASRASDIIYHELGHAVLYGEGVQPGGVNREAGALHEGLADLLAAAYTGDPAIGEWLYLSFPQGATRVDQPVNPWHASNYDRVGFGAAPGTSVWANGMILSGALWDLRGVLGSTCDSLVLESMRYLPTVPTWATFSNAMLQADDDHHASRNAGAIVQAMANRGLQGAVVAAITGPTTLAPGEIGRFVAEPCCGGAVGTYRWQARAWCRGTPCEDWHTLGEGPELRTAFEQDVELRLEVTSPWSDLIVTRRFVGVRTPELDVRGPRRVVQRGLAEYVARAAGMGPLRVQWERQWRRPGAVLEFLGEGEALSFLADTACDVRVSLFDGLLRHTREEFGVETFPDHPLPGDMDELRVSQRSDARRHEMQTTVQLPRSGPLHVAIYDVRGRARATLWNGPAARGAQIVRWDASALEPGLYFMRVLAEPHGTVLRFSLVR